MPKSFSEMITSKALAAYWNIAKNTRAPYFGESKFPTDKKLGLDLSWIKGARNAPVTLSLSAFDAKAIPLNRGEIAKLSANMPFFKNSKNIDETQRQELNKLIGNSNNDAAVKIIVNDIFNDKLALVENALLTLEVMRMQALTTGLVSIQSNGQSYSYDYKVPEKHKVAPTKKWDDTENADPVADINSWADMIEAETGVRPTEALLNSVTLSKIAKCDAVKNAIYVLGNGKVQPSKKQVLQYLQDECEIVFYVNSKVYDNGGTTTKFVADGTVVLMPGTALGKTWFGTTPEESDLMAKSSKAEVTLVEKGIAITTSVETDPVNVQTKVTMIALPSFELAEQVVIASVFTA